MERTNSAKRTSPTPEEAAETSSQEGLTPTVDFYCEGLNWRGIPKIG